MRSPTDPTPPDAPVTVADVQALADAYAAGAVRLHDPVWMTNFRLHQRAAARYRAGPVLLAGDAAHIHSPAGAQGMNTGIQDAVNLAWKLAYTLRGADPSLLDTYEPERAPIGRRVLRMSDRAFTVATSTNPLVRLARTRIAPALIPLVLGTRAVRSYAFRTVAQLNIRYRHSQLSVDGPKPPRRGPKAGDRVPDAPLVHNGRTTTLHTVLGAGGWHLLVCGTTTPGPQLERLLDPYRGHVLPHHLSTDHHPDVLHDPQGLAWRRLGLKPDGTAVYLIRPDGHIGYRSGGWDRAGLRRYLERWLPGGSANGTTDPAPS
jgi:hypothetical protein